jgi:hypothetical protein
LRLRCVNLVGRSLLPYEVTYRRTLLEVLFPGASFLVGVVDPSIPAIRQLDSFSFEGVEYHLVGATGSRKHGHVIYSDVPRCWHLYLGTDANCVNYGSNLTTELAQLVLLGLRILIVKDGDYETGDCHGKWQGARLGLDPYRAAQFRLAGKDVPFLAKGTLLHSDSLPKGVDLVLPLSCFKGEKKHVKEGVFNVEAFFGVKEESKIGSCKISYMVLQHLSKEAIGADILPQTLKDVKTFSEVFKDFQSLKTFVLKEEDEESSFKTNLDEVLKADDYGQLYTHPWVLEKAGKLLQRRWLDAALGGTRKFNFSTLLPDERLRVGECCIPGIPDGEEIIVFPYPCRWKYDLRVWKNVWLRDHADLEGVIFSNQENALQLGRDFDGDRLPWLLASEMPTIAAEIKTFGTPPEEAEKPGKTDKGWTIAETVVESMSNLTGLVSWVSCLAVICKRQDIVEEMVPQLQAAVDSLKGAEPPDGSLISTRMRQLSNAGPVRNWLSDKKYPDVFLLRPMFCEGDDSISYLAKEVSKYWSPIETRKTRLNTFAIGFRSQEARNLINEIMTNLQLVRQKNDPETADVKSLHLLQTWKEKFLEMDVRKSLFLDFWNTQHLADKGTAGLTFFFFPDLVADLVSSQILKPMKLTKKYNCNCTETWNGQLQLVTFKKVEDFWVAINQDGLSLGTVVVSESSICSDGFPVLAILREKSNIITMEVIV